jgi:hypothetical protein
MSDMALDGNESALFTLNALARKANYAGLLGVLDNRRKLSGLETVSLVLAEGAANNAVFVIRA